MEARLFFSSPTDVTQKQYEALRALYHEGRSAASVAKQFTYKISTVYSLARDFKKMLKAGSAHSQFFAPCGVGRKTCEDHNDIKAMAVLARKKYMSVSEIKTLLDSHCKKISERQICTILKAEGFDRLPKRSNLVRNKIQKPKRISAPKADLLTYDKSEQFNTQNAAIFCFAQYITIYGIDKLIQNSEYPGTSTLPKLNSILAFLALKLSNIRRYSSDDLWCMDRGLGLFAGLNVLPKASWYTSYSHRITREMNLNFLKAMNKLWIAKGLLSDSANLDFVAIPYYGESDHLENNWSGTRKQALTSVLAAIAHDPESGIMTYGNTTVRHDDESNTVLEFLDFYRQSCDDRNLKYLIFDSKFTVYENLNKLDDNGVKFITIRKRGKNIVKDIQALPSKDWKLIRVAAHNGTRLIKVIDQEITIKSYGNNKKKIRQIVIDGKGRIKPALIITNDFDLATKDIVRKYSRRWLVEKNIAEQTQFFHLNRLSSSMVIKIDFDLTMTILAHNLYRLIAQDLQGYSHNTSQTLYEKFINNSGLVEINNNEVIVLLRKKRNLPAILSTLNKQPAAKVKWMDKKNLIIKAATFS